MPNIDRYCLKKTKIFLMIYYNQKILIKIFCENFKYLRLFIFEFQQKNKIDCVENWCYVKYIPVWFISIILKGTKYLLSTSQSKNISIYYQKPYLKIEATLKGYEINKKLIN